MKIKKIILFFAFSLSLKIYSNNLYSLNEYLPTSFADFQNFSKPEVSAKLRYKKIEGDLNIFPTEHFSKNKKTVYYDYRNDIRNQCSFPTYRNTRSIDSKDKHSVPSNSFINEKNFPDVAEKDTDPYPIYYKKYVYKSENEIEVYSPSSPYDIKNMIN